MYKTRKKKDKSEPASVKASARQTSKGNNFEYGYEYYDEEEDEAVEEQPRRAAKKKLTETQESFNKQTEENKVVKD